MITFSQLGDPDKSGQLGNQMWQTAMLLGVAAKKGYEVRIPKNFSGIKKQGLVELEPFRISVKNLIGSNNRFDLYQEPTFEFHPDVFEQPDNTDYVGYFQSEKYFIHAEAKIREEFRFKDEFEFYAKEYIQQKRKSDCIVAIQVRRGDYLKCKDVNPILTPAYFQRAMNHSVLPLNKQFLIFSDDRAWCEENLTSLAKDIEVVHSPSHWHDMAVMTFCDAHIISGSSFGWWGAWLCHKQPNIVIVPSPWFIQKPNELCWQDTDLIPDRWYRQSYEGLL